MNTQLLMARDAFNCSIRCFLDGVRQNWIRKGCSLEEIELIVLSGYSRSHRLPFGRNGSSRNRKRKLKQ